MKKINEKVEIDPNVAIKVDNYYKKFRSFVAADDIKFNVNKGSIHGFVGPNGAGKTTTIKAMIGAYLPSSGKILINQFKAGTEKANKLIGYIPERASFPKHLNAIQYLVSMGEFSGLKRKEAKEKANSILKDIGLVKHKHRKPNKFSSGMQKKILLAQALMNDPEILILDEPAANLDPIARADLFEQIKKLRKMNKTILISSHILAELERLIDEVTFLYDGKVIFTGLLSDLALKEFDVFIKSENNKLLKEYLTKNKYKVKGDVKTEIKLENIERKEINKLLKLITKSKLQISSIRTNDLEASYERLVIKARKDKGPDHV